eukprot:TRINITY_DN1726_c0_g1_i1.p1 TRINITY_DN1726_c0_g1~~TRINITY_DN1726_c0_g1_i1.p1  ORF type:complete len:1066 (+),score=224.37 TRINITY_DN1726_c0_g1_i1:78-3200(+)
MATPRPTSARAHRKAHEQRLRAVAFGSDAADYSVICEYVASRKPVQVEPIMYLREKAQCMLRIVPRAPRNWRMYQPVTAADEQVLGLMPRRPPPRRPCTARPTSAHHAARAAARAVPRPTTAPGIAAGGPTPPRTPPAVDLGATARSLPPDTLLASDDLEQLNLTQSAGRGGVFAKVRNLTQKEKRKDEEPVRAPPPPPAHEVWGRRRSDAGRADVRCGLRIQDLADEMRWMCDVEEQRRKAMIAAATATANTSLAAAAGTRRESTGCDPTAGARRQLAAASAPDAQQRAAEIFTMCEQIQAVRRRPAAPAAASGAAVAEAVHLATPGEHPAEVPAQGRRGRAPGALSPAAGALDATPRPPPFPPSATPGDGQGAEASPLSPAHAQLERWLKSLTPPPLEPPPACTAPRGRPATPSKRVRMQRELRRRRTEARKLRRRCERQDRHLRELTAQAASSPAVTPQEPCFCWDLPGYGAALQGLSRDEAKLEVAERAAQLTGQQVAAAREHALRGAAALEDLGRRGLAAAELAERQRLSAARKLGPVEQLHARWHARWGHGGAAMRDRLLLLSGWLTAVCLAAATAPVAEVADRVTRPRRERRRLRELLRARSAATASAAASAAADADSDLPNAPLLWRKARSALLLVRAGIRIDRMRAACVDLAGFLRALADARRFSTAMRRYKGAVLRVQHFLAFCLRRKRIVLQLRHLVFRREEDRLMGLDRSGRRAPRNAPPSPSPMQSPRDGRTPDFLAASTAVGGMPPRRPSSILGTAPSPRRRSTVQQGPAVCHFARQEAIDQVVRQAHEEYQSDLAVYKERFTVWKHARDLAEQLRAAQGRPPAQGDPAPLPPVPVRHWWRLCSGHPRRGSTASSAGMASGGWFDGDARRAAGDDLVTRGREAQRRWQELQLQMEGAEALERLLEERRAACQSTMERLWSGCYHIFGPVFPWEAPILRRGWRPPAAYSAAVASQLQSPMARGDAAGAAVPPAALPASPARQVPHRQRGRAQREPRAAGRTQMQVDTFPTRQASVVMIQSPPSRAPR